jgi:chromosome segregation ATPase
MIFADRTEARDAAAAPVECVRCRPRLASARQDARLARASRDSAEAARDVAERARDAAETVASVAQAESAALAERVAYLEAQREGSHAYLAHVAAELVELRAERDALLQEMAVLTEEVGHRAPDEAPPVAASAAGLMQWGLDSARRTARRAEATPS